MICDVLIFSLDFSINEFIQNYAFDSHSTSNINLIDLTLTYTHALFVFDIGTLLVLWCALFLQIDGQLLNPKPKICRKAFLSYHENRIFLLAKCHKGGIAISQTTIALEMHPLFVINNYISNLNNHILFEMEKT